MRAPAPKFPRMPANRAEKRSAKKALTQKVGGKKKLQEMLAAARERARVQDEAKRETAEKQREFVEAHAAKQRLANSLDAGGSLPLDEMVLTPEQEQLRATAYPELPPHTEVTVTTAQDAIDRAGVVTDRVNEQ